MKIYSVYDKINCKYLSLTPAENDESFIRSSLFSICMDYPIRDVDIVEIGDFDERTSKIKYRKPRVVALDSYLFPRTRMETGDDNLSLDEISDFAQKHKEELQAALKEQKKEVVNE